MTTGKRKSNCSTRRKLCAPGRPPVWQRENPCRFWRGIAAGLCSEEAGVEAGVSAPVGSRWFRSSGGNASHTSVPLCFSAEEPQSFLCRAGRNSLGMREEDWGASHCIQAGAFAQHDLPRDQAELATCSGDLDCRAITAQWHADRAAQRPKASKLANSPALHDYVQNRLAGLIATPNGIAFDGPVVVWKKRRAFHRQSRRWSSARSPAQIAQRLKVDFPEDPTMRISHAAIYQTLYV